MELSGLVGRKFLNNKTRPLGTLPKMLLIILIIITKYKKYLSKRDLFLRFTLSGRILLKALFHLTTSYLPSYLLLSDLTVFGLKKERKIKEKDKKG